MGVPPVLIHGFSITVSIFGGFHSGNHHGRCPVDDPNGTINVNAGFADETCHEHVGFAMMIICRKKIKIEMEIPIIFGSFPGKETHGFLYFYPKS